MNISRTEERNFFGLFELDDAGTVLYSRLEPEDRSNGEKTKSILVHIRKP